MRTCCACGFKYQANVNISFHKFPRDETLRKAWCDAIGPNFSVTNTSILCSQHFLEECFFYPPGGMKLRKYVKQGSLPTMFGFQNKNCQKEKQKMQHDCVSVSAPISVTENKLNNCDTRLRKFQDIRESFDPIEETSFDPIYHIERSMSDLPLDTTNDIQVESMIHIIHDVQSKEIINKQDNLSTQPETPLQKQFREYNPRFIGDCSLNNMKCSKKARRNWKLAMSCIETQKRKINVIQKRNRRLRKKVTDLKSLLSELKHYFNQSFTESGC